jgi:hypothetical protein
MKPPARQVEAKVMSDELVVYFKKDQKSWQK